MTDKGGQHSDDYGGGHGEHNGNGHDDHGGGGYLREVPLFGRFMNKLGAVLEAPVTVFREKFVEPIKSRNHVYFYHRRYRRVPTIDQCSVDDVLCRYEADEQMRRDKKVEDAIIIILRQRKLECEHYHQRPDADKYCQKLRDDYDMAVTNWFIKYGDIGPKIDSLGAFMKQKHRMLWERRHGAVGTGMSAEDNSAPH